MFPENYVIIPGKSNKGVTIMLKSIDYQKYENMNKRQLFNAFLKEEQKYEKLKENFETKVQTHLSLISYLRTKIKSTIDNSKSNLDIAIEQIENEEVERYETLDDFKKAMNE